MVDPTNHLMPLKWLDSEIHQSFMANSIVGHYYVSAFTQLMPKRKIYRWRRYLDHPWSDPAFETAEEAKAAAEADYAESILPWLVASPEASQPKPYCAMPTTGVCDLPSQLKANQLKILILKKALLWYADEAEALARHCTDSKTNAIMASVQILALDGGKRAMEAIG